MSKFNSCSRLTDSRMIGRGLTIEQGACSPSHCPCCHPISRPRKSFLILRTVKMSSFLPGNFALGIICSSRRSLIKSPSIEKIESVVRKSGLGNADQSEDQLERTLVYATKNLLNLRVSSFSSFSISCAASGIPHIRSAQCSRGEGHDIALFFAPAKSEDLAIKNGAIMQGQWALEKFK